MPKKIKSHKDLRIESRGERNSFLLDLNPIGGGRLSFDTKAEASQKAREMCLKSSQPGAPCAETEPWTVEKASQASARFPSRLSYRRCSRNTYMALPKKMKTEGWLFPSSHGTIADGRNWRRYLHETCEKAGLPRDQWPTWHSLRHAYCTSYLNKRDGNFDRAKELMGHSFYQTTLIYRHFVENPERDREDAKAVQSGLNLDINRTPPEAPGDNRVVPLRKKAS